MRTCNRCKADVTGDALAFEGEFIDFNYEIDLCLLCARDFKPFVEQFCKDCTINTNTELTEEEKAEREPVSKAFKKLIKSKEKVNDSMKG